MRRLTLLRLGSACAPVSHAHLWTVAKVIAHTDQTLFYTCNDAADCVSSGLPPTWCETTDAVIAKQRDLFDRYHNSANGRIRMWFAIRTIFNATDELLLRTKSEAAQRGVGIHMHVAEINEEVKYCEAKNGARTVRHLEKCVGPIYRVLILRTNRALVIT